jgi:ligand-binding sensor domain-containing protein
MPNVRFILVSLMIVLFVFSIYAQTYDWTSFTTDNSLLESDNLNSLQISDDGVLWIGSDSGLTGYNGSVWISYDVSNNLAGYAINSVRTNAESLWLGTDTGLSVGQINAMDDINWEDPYRSENSNLINNHINSINIDSFGTRWICTDGGITVITDTSWESFAAKDLYYLERDEVLCINQQPTYMQYLGTQGGGVARLYNVDGVSGASTIWKQWTTYTIPEPPYRLQPGLLSDTVKATLVAKNGDLWFGTEYGVSSHIGPSHSGDYLKNPYSWRSYTTETGLIHNNVQVLAQDSSEAIWIGTSDGVSKLIPADTTWTNFTTDSGLVSNDVRDIAIDPDKSTVWFATSGGLSKLTITPNAIGENNRIIPKSFEVYPAYPNPFNMSTTIKFQLNTSKQIKILIYDINGRLVSTILNSNLMPGSYKIHWNGKNRNGNDTASGVYYAVIHASDQVSRLKLVLVK